MEIVLYQINEERDYNECEFMGYQYTVQFGIDPFSYDRVWSGHLEATTLDGVYNALNQDIRPDNYNGRSMSVSDVCEVIGEDGQSKFYFVDTGAAFKEVKFDPSLTREAKEREIYRPGLLPWQDSRSHNHPQHTKSEAAVCWRVHRSSLPQPRSHSHHYE